MYAVSFWREAQPHQDSQTLQLFCLDIGQIQPKLWAFSLNTALRGKYWFQFCWRGLSQHHISIAISLLYVMSKITMNLQGTCQYLQVLLSLHICLEWLVFVLPCTGVHELPGRVSYRGWGCSHHGHLHHNVNNPPKKQSNSLFALT